MNRRKLQKEKKERKKKMICTWQSSVTRIDSKWRQPWRQDRGITCKNLTGKSPLVLAQGRWSGSKTLVKKASLPSLVHPSHVPPASTSLPPSIFRWPSPHHATGFVGLPSMSIQQQSNLSIFEYHEQQQESRTKVVVSHESKALLSCLCALSPLWTMKKLKKSLSAYTQQKNKENKIRTKTWRSQFAKLKKADSH